MMREHGGFEGNAQTFRIVSQLEPYTQHHGMNLCRRTLLGLIKYPSLLSQVERDPYLTVSTTQDSLNPVAGHQQKVSMMWTVKTSIGY
ncbi:deoxyguanosinetriphosphate triphosphohydrolase [Vibrio ishigakensis]|uniref:Deoxyguanosinetriphosphate triphosphohydrolase n=1 Tax=Vibrio ishigakensis TaxID=1481914 RepID=A0A0B8QDT2_9VIBR|nr:deoxyguanosinetriphosphate triphosphohydrolase [Vibrio ishigakensis]